MILSTVSAIFLLYALLIVVNAVAGKIAPKVIFWGSKDDEYDRNGSATSWLVKLELVSDDRRLLPFSRLLSLWSPSLLWLSSCKPSHLIENCVAKIVLKIMSKKIESTKFPFLLIFCEVLASVTDTFILFIFLFFSPDSFENLSFNPVMMKEENDDKIRSWIYSATFFSSHFLSWCTFFC